MKKLLLLNFLLIAVISYGQATLVKDINSGNFSGFPTHKIKFNGFVYFAANDGINGYELWRTDGTEIGTTLFKEFYIGKKSSTNRFTGVVANNTLFFYGTSNSLWKTDGTAAGTINLINFSGDDPPLGSFEGVEIDNELIFRAIEGSSYSLWKTNGAFNGTQKIKDLRVSNQNGLTKMGNEIFFSGYGNEGKGNELWKTDGTDTGTVLVKDFVGYSTPNPPFFPLDFQVINNNTLIFYNKADQKIWKTDGTTAGTVAINSDSYAISNMVVNNNEVYFDHTNKKGVSSLWKTDGTAAGTIEVKNNLGDVKEIRKLKSKILVFSDNNQKTVIWVSDGSNAGTISFEVGSTVSYTGEIYKVVGDNLFFKKGVFRNNFIYGYELWKTNGTKTGTILVKDFLPIEDYFATFNSHDNIHHIEELNGKAIFSATDGNWLGRELWVSDGTRVGTKILKDINKQGNKPSSPKKYFAFGNKVLFSADNGENGEELWILENQVPSLLKDINVGLWPSNPSSFVELNGSVYFRATTKSKGNELWKTDGTETGTVIVKDINANSADGLYKEGNIVTMNNKLYFFANDGINGYELWESDGTETGTLLVKDINSGINNSYDLRSLKIITFNNKLYFSADDDSGNGLELWTSDGTATGTTLLKNISTNNSSTPNNFIVFDNVLFFTATDDTSTTLWKTDGTPEGTVKNIRSGTRIDPTVNTFIISGAENKNGVLTYDTQLLFIAASSNGKEIWHIEAGTSHNPEPIQLKSRSDPYYLFNNNGETFYLTYSGLWRINKTLTEVNLVKSQDSRFSFSKMVSFGNVVLFGYGNTVQNLELWESDGTEKGTVLLQNMINQTGGSFTNRSSPKNFFAHNNTLYFTADNGVIGEELWKLERSALTIKGQSVNEFAKVSLYPNPSSEKLTIRVGNQQIKSVRLFNINGREVMNSSINKNTINKIDISHLPNGTYILHLKTDKNSFSKKIIKK